ncbi:MAG: magnesium/cobalt transporter CorA [Deltaproteobacteria bacterium]|nr:magnesium/cobalt transporter CorA [Deltaproteobacteria bacterium]MBI4795266.1 magnesium/cobalt transporter CorA [Deltaproteobacteria bacterium]
MGKLVRKRAQKAGLPPGSLVYTGEKMDAKVSITIIEYDEQQYQEREIATFDECLLLTGKPGVTWIKVDGIHSVENLQRLGECFNLHPLVLEDILNTDQRPKIEDFDDYIYIVLRIINYSENNELSSEQISLILGSNFVISLQESNGAVFAPVLERLRTSKGRIRKSGPDYLVYSLMDLIVDNYFVVLEKFGEALEFLEEEVVKRPTPQTLQDVHRFKYDMIMLRKSVWPLREVIGHLERRESDLIQEATAIYFKDVYDHTIVAIDNIETYRDILSGMLDIYLSSISNRLNEIMKVLTIIATIFMPLTFLAGVYGMNFKHMPELEWLWGYPFAVSLMIVIALSMLHYFRRKKWI